MYNLQHPHSRGFVTGIYCFVGNSGLVCVWGPCSTCVLRYVPVLVCPWCKVTYLTDTCAPSTERVPSEISKQTQMQAERGKHRTCTFAGERRGLWGIMALSYPPLFPLSAPSLSENCFHPRLSIHADNAEYFSACIYESVFHRWWCVFTQQSVWNVSLRLDRVLLVSQTSASGFNLIFFFVLWRHTVTKSPTFVYNMLEVSR